MTGFADTISDWRTPCITHICKGCSTCSTRKVCAAMELEQDLPDSSRHPLFHSHVIPSGALLYRAGDQLGALYVIKSGTFKTYSTDEDGNDSVMGFYMAGDILGADALANYKHEYSVVALGTSSVCAVPIKILELEVMRHSSHWLLKQICHGVSHESLTFLLQIRNHNSSYAKLAHFLLKLSSQHQVRGHSERSFRLDMRRQDIANYLGLTIETVSRVLTQLHESNLITLKGREITIIDLDKIKALKQGRTLMAKRRSKTIQLTNKSTGII